MPNILEITGDDIEQLDDSEFRNLIGLLCEADYRQAGLTTKGITWGGHQDAPDGGFDVIVRSEITPPKNSFVPRSITAFQVKKPDMPRSKILQEMKPEGILRKEIKELIQNESAYIIVSSSGSTAYSALKNRTIAMREAVADHDSQKKLHLDFFDRGRVASWVRMHPSMILWVRNKIGRPLSWWQAYGNWANTPGGIEEEYLLGDESRLHDETNPQNGMPVEIGMQTLRSALSIPGTSIRLTGLSGVGKTRLVQALFDERIGTNALNPNQAFYTDIADSPDPTPREFAEQLVAEKTRAILIVDNCSPDLHRQLTKACSKSSVSLLTVEYDIRDDLPEETKAFRLEPASEEIIEKIIGKRFPYISRVDARMIANFSGGNARIAIALANTVRYGDTLSNFRDEQLFERLFWQRHTSSDSLLISAEACSLVYSFEGKDVSSEKSELKLLASLIGKPGSELYRDVTELKKRGLVQSRHVWRAVLPHAIANRLARRALESIPKDTIAQTILYSDSERLIKSFSHRLSYLHDCDPAIEIVNEWLAPEGWIGKENCNFNSFGMDVFRNVAPVAPEKILEAIERAVNGNEGKNFASRDHHHFYEFVKLLAQLAYDPKLFERCVDILCLYALTEKPDERNNSIRAVLKSLFYIYLSGTHATVEARAKVINDLVDSEDENRQDLGIFILDASLEAWNFVSFQQFDFGARSRDFGYSPKSREEVITWYEMFIGICTRLAILDQPIAQKSRDLLSDNLRGLWTRARMFDAVENSAKQIHEQKPWNEGWIAVRGIIRYDSKSFNEEIVERLQRLEKLLCPNNLLERAHAFALTDRFHSFDLADDFDDEDSPSSSSQVEEATQEIGALVSQDNDTLNIMLPELVSTNSPRLFHFGKGLADGCSNKQELWYILYDQLGITPIEKRQINVFLGFLSSCAENDLEFYNSKLDDLIDDVLLGEWFPLLQSTASIDQKGVERLNKSLDSDKAEIHTYKYLAWGRVHESINDDDLASLLKKILTKEGGIDVVIDILEMRFHSYKKKQTDNPVSMICVARDVLTIYPFEKDSYQKRNQDYHLAELARISLKSEESQETAIKVSQQLSEGIINNRIYSFDFPRLLNVLAETHPFVFLNEFLGNDRIDYYHRRRIVFDDHGQRGHPINQISNEDLITWCDIDPEVRYPLAALSIQIFSETREGDGLVWNPIVYSIFDKAPNLDDVLMQFADTIKPLSWSGSRADILERRSALFKSLFDYKNQEISEWAKNQYAVIQAVIKEDREWEKRQTREQYESFE